MKKVAVLSFAIALALSGIGPSLAENSGDEHSAQSRGGFGDSGVMNSRNYGGYDRCNIYRCGGYRHSHYGGDYHGNDYYRHYNHYNNGYYGHYHDGYYRHHYNDAGALIGGLAAGAIVGGLIAQPQGYPVGNSHVDWCYSRYRSYRAYDNTYQPYYGPRQQCYSPY